MKKEIWITIISIVIEVAIIITYNILYVDENSKSTMKSYDINDYEVIEIHYDNIDRLANGIHNRETEGIRKQFNSYAWLNDISDRSLTVNFGFLCWVDNQSDGGYQKLEMDANRIITTNIDDDKYFGFGVYDGNEAYCSEEGYVKSVENRDGEEMTELVRKSTEVLMSEQNRVITDERKLYEYTTILTGREPEKAVLEVDGKVYNDYDRIITKIEFIDQGETRLVKIDSTIMDEDDGGSYRYDSQSYYKIVLKKDNSEFEKEYDEIYDEVKDVPYRDR